MVFLCLDPDTRTEDMLVSGSTTHITHRACSHFPIVGFACLPADKPSIQYPTIAVRTEW